MIPLQPSAPALVTNAACVPFDERMEVMRWLHALRLNDPVSADAAFERAYAYAQERDGCSYGEALLSTRVTRRGHQFVVGRLVEHSLYAQYQARPTA